MRHIFVLFILSSLFLFISTNESSASEIYTVDVESTLSVREGPSTQNKKIGVLHKGQTVEIISFSGEWAQLEYSGTKGFVHKKFLSKTMTVSETNIANKDFRTSTMIAMYGIIILSAVLTIYRIFASEDSLDTMELVIYTTTYFVLCFTELFLTYVISNDYQIYTFDWIKGLDSLFLSIVVSIIGFGLFVYIIFNQVMSFLSLSDELQNHSRYVSWQFGFISTFLFIIVYAIYYLTEWEVLKTYFNYIIGSYILIQIIQLGVILYQMKGYILHAIVFFILLLIAPLSLCFMFVPFLFVFIPILIFIISALGYGKSARSSSSQDRQYDVTYSSRDDLYADTTDVTGTRYKDLNGTNYRKTGENTYEKEY